MATDGRYDLLPKKEVIKLERERKHLQANLAGIKNMTRLPDAIFVIDSNKEQIAVRESRKLGIPVVAVVDTNCDPSEVDYVIPGNDDALRAIRLFTSKISESIAEGVHARDDKQMADIQAVAQPEPVEAVAASESEELYAEAAAGGEVATTAAGSEGAAPEGEEIRMEDVLGKGTRKRPSAATEDVDELQAETRRF
jgi:small subunit ribosomal protein S2